MWKQRLQSGILIILVLVMSFSMEVSIVQAAEQISSGVHTIMFGGDRYTAKDGSVLKNGEEIDLDLEGGSLIKYGIMDGILCALVDKDGEEQWIGVDGQGAQTGVVSGSAENESIIFSFLTGDLGLNIAAACGILANINNESGFNPQSSCIDTNGLISYGICQWNGGRFTALQRYCAANGYDYTTLAGQLLYLKYELATSESTALSKVSSVVNTQEGAFIAGYNWATYYERCASKYFASRAVLARDVYWPKYVSGSQPVSTLTAMDLSMLAAGSAPYVAADPNAGTETADPIAPSISSAGVTGLSATDAQLNYQMINPAASVITYIGAFVYDAAGNEIGAFGSNPLYTDVTSEGSYLLSKCIGSLTPSTTYQYRFIVKTENARVVSELYSFTTPAAESGAAAGDGQTDGQDAQGTQTDGGEQGAAAPVQAQISGAWLTVSEGQLQVQYSVSVDAKMEIVLYDAAGTAFYTKYTPIQAGSSQLQTALSEVELPEGYSASVRILSADSKPLCDAVAAAVQ